MPQKTQAHHDSSPGAGWSSPGEGGCSPSTQQRGEVGQELLLSEAVERDCGERVALLPPESPGRASRQ